MSDSKNVDLEKMNKRRELMEDRRRYIIFYTFGSESKEPNQHEESSQLKLNEEKNV